MRTAVTVVLVLHLLSASASAGWFQDKASEAVDTAGKKPEDSEDRYTEIRDKAKEAINKEPEEETVPAERPPIPQAPDEGGN